jgi:uncharacterized protein (TIGR02145 family)
MKKVSLILTLLFSCSCIVHAQTKYPKVTIGKQVWMTENLNVDKFRNGDPIPHAKTDEEWVKARENGQPAWCYYDHRAVQNDSANGDKYGKLYNWYAVNDPRSLAPKGWHIPTDDEWTVLTNFLGGYEVDKKMKSTSGWEYNLNGNNSNGFSGLPGGYRDCSGTFTQIGGDGNWWSSAEYGTYDAWYRNLFAAHDYVYRNYCNKGNGFSVRCLRD